MSRLRDNIIKALNSHKAFSSPNDMNLEQFKAWNYSSRSCGDINKVLSSYNETPLTQFKEWKYLGDLDISTLKEDEQMELLTLCRKKANFTAAANEFDISENSRKEYIECADEAANMLEQKIKALKDSATSKSSTSLKM